MLSWHNAALRTGTPVRLEPLSRGLRPASIGPVLATAGHFLIDGNGNLIDISGLNIPAGSEFRAALSN